MSVIKIDLKEQFKTAFEVMNFEDFPTSFYTKADFRNT